MTAPTTSKPSSWVDGIHPIGAVSGRPAPSSAPEVREVTSHRRSGVERLELVAAGIGGGVAALLLMWIYEKKVRRA